jgi:hypothetical protein
MVVLVVILVKFDPLRGGGAPGADACELGGYQRDFMPRRLEVYYKKAA